MLNIFGWITGTKFDISKLFIGILILITAILCFSGFNTIMDKLGFETVATMRVKLDAANATVSSLQASNNALVAQAKQAEERHKVELETLAAQLKDQKEIANNLAKAKQKITIQNASLKKQLSVMQEEAYLVYNIPKDKYYVYAKDIVLELSKNNYDAISSFIGTETKEVPKVVQDKRSTFQQWLNKIAPTNKEPDLNLKLTQKLLQ